MLLVTLALSFPLGVATAIYLEEFAPRNRWTDLIEVNINNLAAVPSIVFGLLGLALFINLFGLPRSAPLVGGLVLSLMTLPVIIIASRAALTAVPPSIREAALGLGASKMQMVLHHVLPLAMPGMLTGTIIGMARALGESAPLLMIGMVAFIVDVPDSPLESRDGAARAGLPLGRQPGARVRRAHVGGDRRAAVVPARDERRRDPVAETFRAALLAASSRIVGVRCEPRRRKTEQLRVRGRNRSGRSAVRASRAAESGGRRRLSHGRRLHVHQPRDAGAAGRRLLRRQPRDPEGQSRHRPQRGHRADRSVGLRQVDVHSLPEPHERHDRVGSHHGRHHARRREHLRAAHGRRDAARARRHGVPEAESVPEVRLRQRRVRAAHPRARARSRRARRDRAEEPRARGALDRGQGSARGAGHRVYRAASSSGSASRARSRSTRTSFSWTSRARRSTRSRRRVSRT